MRKAWFVLVMLFILACPVHAADIVGTSGTPNSSGVYTTQVDTDRVVTVASDATLYVAGATKMSYEAAITSDTLTALESGKTFIVNPTTQMTFTLPDADVGLMYTFTASNGNAAGTKKFILDPKSTDTLRGVVNSSSTSTFAVGDSVISPGVTGDSITIFCAEDTYWDVVARIGTFVDNN